MKVVLLTLLLALGLVGTQAGGRDRDRSGGSNEGVRRPSSNDLARVKALLQDLAAGGNANLIRYMQIWVGRYSSILRVHPMLDLPIEEFPRNPMILQYGNQIFGEMITLIGTIESGSKRDIRAYFRTKTRNPGLFRVGIDYFQNSLDAFEWTFDTVLGSRFGRSDKHSWDRFTRYVVAMFQREIDDWELNDDDKQRIRDAFTVFAGGKHAKRHVIDWIKSMIKNYTDIAAFYPELASIPEASFDETNEFVNAGAERYIVFFTTALEKLDDTEALLQFITAGVSSPDQRGQSAEVRRHIFEALMEVIARVHRNRRQKFTHHDKESLQKLFDISISLGQTYYDTNKYSGQFDAPLTWEERKALDQSIGQYRAAADYPRLFLMWFDEFPAGRCHFVQLCNLKRKFFANNAYIRNVIGPKIMNALINFRRLANETGQLNVAVRSLLLTDEFESMTLDDIKDFFTAFRLVLEDFYQSRFTPQRGPRGFPGKRRGSYSHEQDNSWRYERYLAAWDKFIEFLIVKFTEELGYLGRLDQ